MHKEVVIHLELYIPLASTDIFILSNIWSYSVASMLMPRPKMVFLRCILLASMGIWILYDIYYTIVMST